MNTGKLQDVVMAGITIRERSEYRKFQTNESQCWEYRSLKGQINFLSLINKLIAA